MNNIDIAKTYITAVQTGDQATLGSIISPDVVWYQPGNNRFSGTHRGMANGDWVAITLEFAGDQAQEDSFWGR